MIGAAAVACGANADTVTTNGVTWTYTVVDSSASPVTVKLGNGSAACIATDTSIDASKIPWTFEKDGTAYKVTQIAAYAFKSCSGLTGRLTIPEDVTSIATQAFMGSRIEHVARLGKNTGMPNYNTFRSCTNLKGVYAPGADKVTSGTQSYTGFSINNTFQDSTNLKIVLLGYYTQMEGNTSNTLLNNVKNCKVFLPANGTGNKKWQSFTMNLGSSATGSKTIYYGPNRDLDLVVDDDAGTITFWPTTETALVDVLEAAPTFKDEFGWNVKVNVTNILEATSGAITAEMLNAVEINTLMLTFKVNTQEQLDSVLAAVPTSSHTILAIDASDSKVELTVPQGREVYVRLSGEGRNGKYTPKIKGLIISFF